MEYSLPDGVKPNWKERFWMNRMDLRRALMNSNYFVSWLLVATVSNLIVWLMGGFNGLSRENSVAVFQVLIFLSFILAVFVAAAVDALFEIRSFPYCPACKKVVEHRINFYENPGYNLISTQLGDFFEPKPGTIIPFCKKCGSVATWEN